MTQDVFEGRTDVVKMLCGRWGTSSLLVPFPFPFHAPASSFLAISAFGTSYTITDALRSAGIVSPLLFHPY